MPTTLKKSAKTLYSVAESAHYLGLSERRIRQLCAAGTLPATRLGDRAWTITATDLEHFSRRPRPAGNPTFGA